MKEFEKLENLARKFLNECVEEALSIKEVGDVIEAMNRALLRERKRVSPKYSEIRLERVDIPEGDIYGFKKRWGVIK